MANEFKISFNENILMASVYRKALHCYILDNRTMLNDGQDYKSMEVQTWYIQSQGSVDYMIIPGTFSQRKQEGKTKY